MCQFVHVYECMCACVMRVMYVICMICVMCVMCVMCVLYATYLYMHDVYNVCYVSVECDMFNVFAMGVVYVCLYMYTYVNMFVLCV